MFTVIDLFEVETTQHFSLEEEPLLIVVHLMYLSENTIECCFVLRPPTIDHLLSGLHLFILIVVYSPRLILRKIRHVSRQILDLLLHVTIMAGYYIQDFALHTVHVAVDLRKSFRLTAAAIK